MFSKAIYYFSATGNSLTTARAVAKHLNNCKLIPIVSLLDKEQIIVNSSIVGFVFPVYFQDIPYPVRNVLKKMKFVDNNPYIFSFTTSRGYPGDLIGKRMNQLLIEKGQKLSLNLSIPMPGNSKLNPYELDKEYLDKQYITIKEKTLDVLEKKEINYSTTDDLFVTPTMVPNNFRGLISDNNCVGCKTCVKVCPMNNISIMNGKAIIGDFCASCLACFHWCPIEAIYMSKNTDDGRRIKYHHPEVNLIDIMNQKKER